MRIVGLKAQINQVGDRECLWTFSRMVYKTKLVWSRHAC